MSFRPGVGMTQREYRLVVELFVESHYGAETPGTVSIRDPRLAVGHPHTVAVPQLPTIASYQHTSGHQHDILDQELS